MKNTRVWAVVVCVMAAANLASADTIRGIDIDFVSIGNAGNVADTGGTPGCGAVSYDYRIGKYEITNAQWNTFISAAGSPTGNDGGYSYSSYFTGDQQPTDNISWYEALQFCNYLTSGDKSKGVYQFSGNNANPGSFISIDRATAKAIYGTIYFLPTEDEWYKAAYYKSNSSGYSLYANGTNTAPSHSDACYDQYSYAGPWDVGLGAQEQNGTFDMMGNIYELTESLYDGDIHLRGGSFDFYDSGSLLSSGWYSISPSTEGIGIPDVGFRVGSVPEPAMLLLVGLGGLVLRGKNNNNFFGRKRK